jgi:tRNA threonylcarbamoyladenosine biosynthesis protein TsaB
MKLLAADTATPSLSVAVTDGGEVRAEITVRRRQTHTRTLMRQLEAVLELAGVELAELDGLAAVAGPGSFTGLRIGLSTVKGIAMGLGKPAVGVSALEGLARQLPGVSGSIHALIDARKGQVYRGMFRWEGDRLTELAEPSVLGPEAAAAELRPGSILVGDGARLYGEAMTRWTGSPFRVAPSGVHTLRASTAARMAREKMAAGAPCDPAGLLPQYLRPSDAELARAAG